MILNEVPQRLPKSKLIRNVPTTNNQKCIPTTKNVSLEMNDKLMKSLRILRVTKNGTKLTKVCMRIRINLYYIVWNALADNSVFSFCSYQGYVLATSGSEEDKNGSLLEYFSKENIRIWTHEVDMISRLAYSGGNENILTSSWHGKGKLKITKVFLLFLFLFICTFYAIRSKITKRLV